MLVDRAAAPGLDAPLVIALLATAVFATAVCFALYTWAQARTSATHAALIFALEPVFAALTAWIWSGERWRRSLPERGGIDSAAILFVELKPSFGQVHPQSQAGA